jgi:hypothetical protein
MQRRVVCTFVYDTCSQPDKVDPVSKCSYARHHRFAAVLHSPQETEFLASAKLAPWIFARSGSTDGELHAHMHEQGVINPASITKP